MKTKHIIAGLVAASLAVASLAAEAADIHVMSSAGFKAAYLELVQQEGEAGEALIEFLAAPEAIDAIRKSGMEPARGE